MKWPHKAAIAAAFLLAYILPAFAQDGTRIGFGSLAGEFLAWIAAAFALPIGALLTSWLYRVFRLAGINAGDALRTRLQEIVVNGLNAGVAALSEKLKGRGEVVVKNQVGQYAIQYVQQHGADTIRQLGLDPKSGEAVEAIKARIETAIADPLTPTPAVLVPATVQKGTAT